MKVRALLFPGELGHWTDNIGNHIGLKSMGKEFVTGYLNIADGEKDPRNLLLAFSIDRVVLIEFDISSHVEVGSCAVLNEVERLLNDIQSFFDVTFCYFPITFRPPPDDPYGITPEQLKEKLLSVFHIISTWRT